MSQSEFRQTGGGVLLDGPANRVDEFLRLWHEAGRADFERSYPRLNYDTDQAKTAKDRRKYIALDCGTSGVYLLDKATEDVYSIKGYGVPNRKVGTLDGMIAAFREMALAS